MIARKEPGQRLLHGEVVIVAHLGLPIVQGPLPHRALGHEQVSVSVPGAFQVSIQHGVGLRIGLRRSIQPQRFLQPEFGQYRQPLLVAQRLRLTQRSKADGSGCLAFVLADADHLQCGPHRSAELPCAQHIPAAQGHVVPGFKSGYLDSGATTQRQKQQHEECPSPDVVAI